MFRLNFRIFILQSSCILTRFTVLLAFEEESAKSAVTAVPGIGGQICCVSQDMSKHSHQLRTARKQGLRTFPTVSDSACENSDFD